jgi:hypothetical protein
MEDVAHLRASLYAPLPKRAPLITGISGTLIASVSVLVFVVSAHLDLERFEWPFILTAILAFLVPFLFLKHRERMHRKAWLNEFRTIRDRNETHEPKG